jgi:hypothetical protein
VWRREGLITKGGRDEDWRCNEDSELAARFHDVRQRIVCMPMMAAHYIPRGSFPALWQHYLSYGIYRAKTVRRHPRSLRRSAVLPPLLVLNAAASLLALASLRRVPHAGLAAYAAALSVATAQAARLKEGPADVVDLLVAAALLTMHLANGVGFLIGCARWGVPWRALSHVAGGGGEYVPYCGDPCTPRACSPSAADVRRTECAHRQRAAQVSCRGSWTPSCTTAARLCPSRPMSHSHSLSSS